MRPQVFMASFALLLAAAGISAAQEVELSRQHHPWGHFRPGAWKMVRVVTETLDERGLVTSTTTHDTRTVLQSVDANGVTLDVAVTVEVAGKRFEAEPQTVTQPFHSEAAGADSKPTPSGETTVTIEGKKVPVHLARLEYNGPNNTNKTATNIYYSDKVSPFVLRRETTTTDADGTAIVNESVVEVLATEMPWKASGEIKTTSLVKSTVKNSRGTIVTFAHTSPEVPGGVVSHTSKEIDRSGRIVRRSTLELVDFGLERQEEPGGLFRLKRRPRFHN